MEMKDFEDLPEILLPLAVAYMHAQPGSEEQVHAWRAWATACDMLLKQELGTLPPAPDDAEYMTAEENAVWDRWEHTRCERLLTDEQRAIIDAAVAQLKPALEMLASKGEARH